MKQSLAILLALLLTIALTACSSQQQATPAEIAAAETPVAGGWMLYDTNL